MDADIEQFISYMVTRSKHFKDLMVEREIEDEEEFVDRHLYKSVCIVLHP